MKRPWGWLCLLAASAAWGQENIQLASFDQVWKTVKERHWDKEKTGAAWEQARERLRPEAERAVTADDVRPVIQKLLGTLGQSHFYVIPGEAYDSLAGGKDGPAEVGWDFRLVDGDVVVTRGKGEVKAGWAIEKIGTDDVRALTAKAKRAAKSEREEQLLVHGLVRNRLRGAAGEKKTVTFGLDGGASKEMEVSLEAPEHPVQFGNLPPFGMEIEARRAGDLGYFRFNVFFDPERLQDELGKAVRGCADCRGFILDLRGNFGGIAALAPAVAGWFVPEQRALGTMMSTMGKLNLTIFPRLEHFDGKLAVLVDSLSISSAEFLAAGLKDMGRARLFGETTQGAALPSIVEKLPNGDRFQFAVADYISAGGEAVEGAGVSPNLTVRMNRMDLLAGRDAAWEAAREWIGSSSN